jgi:hypothetical protein
MNDTIRTLIAGLACVLAAFALGLIIFSFIELRFSTTEVSMGYMIQAIEILIVAGTLPIIGGMIEFIHPEPVRTERLQWE